MPVAMDILLGAYGNSRFPLAMPCQIAIAWARLPPRSWTRRSWEPPCDSPWRRARRGEPGRRSLGGGGVAQRADQRFCATRRESRPRPERVKEGDALEDLEIMRLALAEADAGIDDDAPRPPIPAAAQSAMAQRQVIGDPRSERRHRPGSRCIVAGSPFMCISTDSGAGPCRRRGASSRDRQSAPRRR